MNIANLIEQTKKKLQQADSKNAQLDTELIISHFTGINRLELNLHSKYLVKTKIQLAIKQAVQRRMQLEPLQYIFGETKFYDFPIKVNPAVLIPRPETELLVEKITKNNNSLNSILDLGTGSGAIAIYLAKAFPKAQIIASDISEKALKIARENAKMNNAKIKFIQSDLFQNISKKFDLIVSNPPYISEKEFLELPPEIKNYEPKSALLAKENGLEFYRKILQQANSFLQKNGKVYFEIGAEQTCKIEIIAHKHDFQNVTVFQDLNSFDRIMQLS